MVPVTPATWEAKEGESLEPGRWRSQWAEMAPLHSTLGNNSKTLSPKRKKRNWISTSLAMYHLLGYFQVVSTHQYWLRKCFHHKTFCVFLAHVMLLFFCGIRTSVTIFFLIHCGKHLMGSLKPLPGLRPWTPLSKAAAQSTVLKWMLLYECNKTAVWSWAKLK